MATSSKFPVISVVLVVWYVSYGLEVYVWTRGEVRQCCAGPALAASLPKHFFFLQRWSVAQPQRAHVGAENPTQPERDARSRPHPHTYAQHRYHDATHTNSKTTTSSIRRGPLIVISHICLHSRFPYLSTLLQLSSYSHTSGGILVSYKQRASRITPESHASAHIQGGEGTEDFASP